MAVSCDIRDTDIAAADAVRVQRAARIIRSGGIVGHATEGVWGLACNPFLRESVERLLRLKGRSVQKGLIVIGADAEMFASELLTLDESLRRDVLATWPGPVTWVVPNRRFPRWITGRHTTIAVRVPGHPQARRLCRAVGHPIVSTSANPAGRTPAPSALVLRRYFPGDIDAVLAGEVGGRRAPSEIRLAASGRTLRTSGT